MTKFWNAAWFETFEASGFLNRVEIYAQPNCMQSGNKLEETFFYFQDVMTDSISKIPINPLLITTYSKFSDRECKVFSAWWVWMDRPETFQFDEY